MRLPEIDWAEVLPVLESIHARSPALLDAFADMPVQPQFGREHVGGHDRWLVEQGVLDEVGPGRRLLHTTGSRSLRVLLRAARACEVLDGEDEDSALDAIRDYLARNFTGAQRSVVLDGPQPFDDRTRRALLAHVTSVHRHRTFFGLEDPAAFDAAHAGRVYGPSLDTEVHALVCHLASCAAEAPLRIPDDVASEDGALLVRAIEAGIRYLLLFPRLKDGVLVLGLQPCARDDIRGMGDESLEVVPGRLPAPRAHLLEDAETVFVHACTHPIRVKADGHGLYQRDLDALVAGLATAPTRIVPEDRVVHAVNVLLTLDALERGTTVSARRCLLATEAGHDWLAAPPAHRFEPLLAGVRQSSPTERLRRLGLLDGFYYLDVGEAHVLWDGLVALYRGLPRDGGVSLDRLIAQGIRYENPMDADDLPYAPWRADAWGEVLRGFLDWLGSLGGLCFAVSGDEVVVGGCAMGDYILGLSEEAPAVETPEARVVVQPNFDVVFLGPSPVAEAALARFCERGAHGHVGTLFRITRASVMRAGAAGLGVEAIESALEAHTDGAPANVRHEIAIWLERVRRVRATSGIVVECPDAETADRIESASRGDAFTRLTPTLLLATDRKAFDRAARALAGRGVLFDLDLTADPVPRKKRSRRRRRRW